MTTHRNSTRTRIAVGAALGVALLAGGVLAVSSQAPTPGAAPAEVEVTAAPSQEQVYSPAPTAEPTTAPTPAATDAPSAEPSDAAGGGQGSTGSGSSSSNAGSPASGSGSGSGSNSGSGSGSGSSGGSIGGGTGSWTNTPPPPAPAPSPAPTRCPTSRSADPATYDACRAGYVPPTIVFAGLTGCTVIDRENYVFKVTWRWKLQGGTYKTVVWDGADAGGNEFVTIDTSADGLANPTSLIIVTGLHVGSMNGLPGWIDYIDAPDVDGVDLGSVCKV